MRELELWPWTGARLEDRLYQHLDWRVPPRPRTHELVGDEMIQAGMEMGSNTPYGQYISRSSSKVYGLYHIGRHFCPSKVINNHKKWDIQVDRWVCVCWSCSMLCLQGYPCSGAERLRSSSARQRRSLSKAQTSTSSHPSEVSPMGSTKPCRCTHAPPSLRCLRRFLFWGFSTLCFVPLQDERRMLLNKRLDLDIAHSRLRKAHEADTEARVSSEIEKKETVVQRQTFKCAL